MKGVFMNYENYINEMVTLLQIKGCTAGTIKVYRLTLLRFLTHMNKPVEEISAEEIMNYLHYMISLGRDNSTVNNNHSIITFFFAHVLKKPEVVFSIPFMKKIKTTSRYSICCRT